MKGRVRQALAFALAATVIPLGSTMLAVAIPAIGADLGIDPTTLTPWIVTSYLLVALVGTAPGGRLGDALGARRALALGQASCVAGALVGAAANGLAVLVAGRVLVAAGGAIMVPAAMALLRELTAPDRRARAFGLFGSLMGLAAAIGPLVGGEITHLWGWRASFLAQVAPLLVSVALAHGSVPTPPRVTRGPELALAASLLRSRAFVGGAATVALLNCALYGVLFQVPLLLGVLRGESEAVVGRALLGMTGAMIVGSGVGGHVSDRIGARWTVLLAACVALSGLLLLRDVAGVHVALDALPGLALLGFGVGLTNGPSHASALSAAPAGRAATAAGVLSASRYVGGVLGMLLISPLRSGVAPAVAEALHARALGGMALAVVLACGVAFLVPGRPRPGVE